MPESVWGELDGRARAIRERNRKLTAELIRVLAEFEREGIRAVPFKGPVLAASAYGDIGLRQFSDLDVLAPRPDLPRAAGLLTRLGYSLKHRSPRARDAIFLRTEYHCTFVEPGSGAELELHGDVAPWFLSVSLSIEELFSRLETVVLQDHAVKSLAAEDLLLILCVHGAKHSWHCLELVSSIARLVAWRPDLDWRTTLQRAQRIGARRLLLVGLTVAREMLAAPLPEAITAAAGADAETQALAADIAARYLGQARRGPEFIDSMRFQLRSRERVRDRLRYALRHLFTPNWEEIEWYPLPRRLFPLYWLLRPARIAMRWGPEMAKLVIGRR